MVFRIASSPYTHNQRQTSRIMLLVLLSLIHISEPTRPY